MTSKKCDGNNDSIGVKNTKVTVEPNTEETG
jgi:hypothetical protein